MTEHDGRIAQLLREVAEDMPVDPALARGTLGRARRQRLANASLVGVTAVVLVAGSFAGLRALTPKDPTVPGGRQTPTAAPTPSPERTDVPPADLPDAVAETWAAVVRGVEERDFAALEALIDPDRFAYNFDDGSNPIALWREDPTVLDPIPQILRMPFVVTPVDAPGMFVGDVYQWPYLMESGSLDEISQQERDDLHALGFSDREIEQMREFGGYLGPRIVIRADGVWAAYVTGGD